MHVGIAVTLMVGFFTMGILVCYLAFVPPETAAGWVRAAVARVAERRSGLGVRTFGPAAEGVGRVQS
jgi:hypothetical protein